MLDRTTPPGDNDDGKPKRVEYAADGTPVSATADAIRVAFFETHTDPVFLIGEDAKILRANLLAIELLEQGGPLVDRDGFLEGSDGAASDLLLSLIRIARTEQSRQAFGAFPQTMGYPWAARMRVVATIIEPTEMLSLTLRTAGPQSGEFMAALAPLFGLTAMEQQVLLEIGAGRTPHEAAENLGIAFETVRSHLKKVHTKTGTSHRGELVELVGRFRL